MGKKNPGYTEISSRALLDWAERSGLWRENGYKTRSCNDKPDMNLSIASMDQGGQLEKIVKFWASMQQRNYVIMEVKGNLVKDEREALLKRFPSDNFRKVAHV